MKSHPSHKLYGVDVKELEGEEDLYAACFTLFHFKIILFNGSLVNAAENGKTIFL